MTSITMNLENINKARNALESADRVLLGIGAGVSASSGLNYADPSLVERFFPEYRGLGLNTIQEIMGRFWWLQHNKPEEYWAFWARHIYHIRYEPEALEPYRLLYQLMAGKDYFIVSTNVDSQLEKAGFPGKRIFAPQGDYGLFQCSRPCSQAVYDNWEMIETMVANMPDPFHVRAEDVPRCPKCGAYLIPNLRCDNRFVEKPHLENMPEYRRYISDAKGQRLVMLELGVGYNTPVIIRFPFEELARKHHDAFIIRVNMDDADIPSDIHSSGLSFVEDICAFLQKCVNN